MSWTIRNYDQAERLPDALASGVSYGRDDLDGAVWVGTTDNGDELFVSGSRVMCLMSIDLDCWRDGSDKLSVVEGVAR